MADTPHDETPDGDQGGASATDLPALARHAFQTGGGIRLLIELLDASDYQPENYDQAARAALIAAADSVSRMSVYLAIASADPKVLSEVTGKDFRQVRPRWRPDAADGEESSGR